MTDSTDMDGGHTAANSPLNADGHVLPEFMGHVGFERELLDNSSNLICFCRCGTIEYVNVQGVRMLRAGNADNLVGRPFSNFCDDEFGALFAQELDAFAHDDESILLKLQALDGAWIDVTMRIFRLDGRGSQADPVYMIECNDISQYTETSELTRRREARIERVLQTITEAIITADEIGTIEDINPAAEKMFGVSKQAAVGQNVKIFMKAANDDALLRYFNTGDTAILGELREAEAVRADGTAFPVEITISEIDEGEGRRKFIGVMRDITVRKQQFEQIEFLAHHDALTGLPNRHLFDDRLTQALIVAGRRQSRLALMFIDLDKFKLINDTLGHEAGDIVLKSVAARLLDRVRASDTVARVGGDEFAVILDDVGANENAAQIARDIIATLTTPIEAGGEECTVGASIGIALYPEDADTASGLLACADETMYRVKAAGRSNFLFFNVQNNNLTKNS
ncbi:MAG: diguanylate cyclase [Alphaproteobacteria bacterium]|nr:diguanylate cyclase [Alphaproteobacteria bacterium]